MPVIDLDIEDVGDPAYAELLPLAGAMIGAVMLYPDDEKMRAGYQKAAWAAFQARKSPAQLVAELAPFQEKWPSVGANTLAWLAAAPSHEAMGASIQARLAQGILTGHVLRLLLESPGKVSVKSAKARAIDSGGRHFTDEHFNNIIWKRHRPVAHWWAAYVERETTTVHRADTFPCRAADLVAFIERADHLLAAGARCRPPRAPRPVLDPAMAWVMPPRKGAPPGTTIQ